MPKEDNVIENLPYNIVDNEYRITNKDSGDSALYMDKLRRIEGHGYRKADLLGHYSGKNCPMEMLEFLITYVVWIRNNGYRIFSMNYSYEVFCTLYGLLSYVFMYTIIFIDKTEGIRENTAASPYWEVFGRICFSFPKRTLKSQWDCS